PPARRRSGGSGKSPPATSTDLLLTTRRLYLMRPPNRAAVSGEHYSDGPPARTGSSDSREPGYDRRQVPAAPALENGDVGDAEALAALDQLLGDRVRGADQRVRAVQQDVPLGPTGLSCQVLEGRPQVSRRHHSLHQHVQLQLPEAVAGGRADPGHLPAQRLRVEVVQHHLAPALSMGESVEPDHVSLAGGQLVKPWTVAADEERRTRRLG